ncbi:MAG: helix-turn-helix transcriptional regulator [Candidatus Eremiobacteraeota bacterium]|nr:helix-turn-helix transcriptional regulator [Candidatus Eremiobacteraeota bacterium]
MDRFFMDDIERWENDPEYQTEILLLDLNERICEWMEKQGVNRAELARRLGKSRAYITRMLNGKPNLTIGSLVKVASALGVKVEIGLASPSPPIADSPPPEEEKQQETEWKIMQKEREKYLLDQQLKSKVRDYSSGYELKKKNYSKSRGVLQCCQ